MIIVGTPRADEMDKYYMADGDIIWELTKAGFHARYIGNDGEQYFKLNKKLKEYLAKIFD